MKRTTLGTVLVLIGCGQPNQEQARALSPDDGSAPAMSAAEAFENACNTESPGRWQLVVDVTEDLHPTSTIVCDTRPVIIRGNGFSIYNHGISFPSQAANWSTVENLRFIGQDYHSGLEPEHQPHTPGETIGINIEAHGIRLNNIFVKSYDIGVRVYGSANNNTNANTTVFEHGQLYHNGIGLYITGGDSQAGRFSDISTRNNTVHIWDSSFLGNIHIGGVADGHGIYRRHDSPAAYSTLLGVYVEGNPLPPNAIDIKGYNLVVGGSLSLWSSYIPITGTVQATVSPHGNSALGFSSHNHDMRVKIPAHDRAALSIGHRNEEFYAWHAFRYFDHNDKWALAAYLNSGYHYPLLWNGKHSNGYVGDLTIRDWTGGRVLESYELENQ